MININDKITLRAKTPKAAGKIGGKTCTGVLVTNITSSVGFSDKLGPWLFLGEMCRWVHETNDKEFEVIHEPSM